MVADRSLQSILVITNKVGTKKLKYRLVIGDTSEITTIDFSISLVSGVHDGKGIREYMYHESCFN